MIQKKLSVFFLIFAQLTLLCHGIIAHHHHEDNVAIEHHHGQNEDSDHSSIDFLDAAFSGLTHSSGDLTYSHSDISQIGKVNVVSLNSTGFNSEYISLVSGEAFTLLKALCRDKCENYDSEDHQSYSQRGPPFFIVA